jgi:hypothetical protein
MKIGDTARVTNRMRHTYGMVGEIKRISGPGESDDLRIVDLAFSEDEGHCVWSYVENEIQVFLEDHTCITKEHDGYYYDETDGYL